MTFLAFTSVSRHRRMHLDECLDDFSNLDHGIELREKESRDTKRGISEKTWLLSKTFSFDVLNTK